MQGQTIVRDPATDYRRLVAALASKAARLGSTDGEAAAQEALRRSLAHPISRAAIVYYFREDPAIGAESPEWQLQQLFAWLYGVLRFVVREERAHASARREFRSDDGVMDVCDPSPDQLEALIDDELRGIVRECLTSLKGDQRRVLLLRAEGLKYEQIAARLGVSGNTVATWVRRGTHAVTRLVEERMRAQAHAIYDQGYQKQ
ncbi:MAG TPA: RNA polymerase sigma factor [Vicinamibacterales bacterium]|nr:RNA polymerase sigma factor [Vicinamibacterales bacterium]